LDTTAVAQLFREKFNQAPVCRAGAPGRLEVLGNHTDYNDGLVMSVAVHRRSSAH
jgi:galactokinase